MLRASQESAEEAIAQAKATLAKAGDLYQREAGTVQGAEVTAQAVQTEIGTLETMAQSVEQAQTMALNSMAAAMSAVGASAGAGGASQANFVPLEEATLQAIQGMTSAT